MGKKFLNYRNEHFIAVIRIVRIVECITHERIIKIYLKNGIKYKKEQ